MKKRIPPIVVDSAIGVVELSLYMVALFFSTISVGGHLFTCAALRLIANLRAYKGKEESLVNHIYLCSFEVFLTLIDIANPFKPKSSLVSKLQVRRNARAEGLDDQGEDESSSTLLDESTPETKEREAA